MDYIVYQMSIYIFSLYYKTEDNRKLLRERTVLIIISNENLYNEK